MVCGDINEAIAKLPQGTRRMLLPIEISLQNALNSSRHGFKTRDSQFLSQYQFATSKYTSQPNISNNCLQPCERRNDVIDMVPELPAIELGDI